MRAHPQIEWVDSSSDGFGMEVQPAQMEVDRIGEPLLVAEPAAGDPDHPDPAVDALRRAVGDLQHHRIGDAPQVVPDRPGTP